MYVIQPLVYVLLGGQITGYGLACLFVSTVLLQRKCHAGTSSAAITVLLWMVLTTSLTKS
jgi:hypothetical protein